VDFLLGREGGVGRRVCSYFSNSAVLSFLLSFLFSTSSFPGARGWFRGSNGEHLKILT
jgi:hypothetical protein